MRVPSFQSMLWTAGIAVAAIGIGRNIPTLRRWMFGA